MADGPAGDFHITPGQLRVVRALLLPPHGRTYAGAAAALSVSVGTVYVQLRRLRCREPELYDAFMAIRQDQLTRRHERALRRAELHSREWHRKKSARRYFYRFGVWPHEAKLYRQLGRLDLLEVLRRSRGY